jgi:hypothetical protein
MLTVVVLSVIMLGVIILIVVAPKKKVWFFDSKEMKIDENLKIKIGLVFEVPFTRPI